MVCGDWFAAGRQHPHRGAAGRADTVSDVPPTISNEGQRESTAVDDSGQPVQVLVTPPQAVNRIARRVILLDEIVRHVSQLRGLHDGGDIQRTAAHFSECGLRHLGLVGFARRVLRLVLQVEQRNVVLVTSRAAPPDLHP